MTDQLENLLRDTFTQAAQDASPVPDLARTARAALHRRRQRITRAAVAAVVVVGLTGALTWDATKPTRSPAPADRGSVTVVPSPTAGDLCLPLSDCAAEKVVAPLRRPLHLPKLTAGEACPVSTTRELPQGGGFTGPITATGPGPVYMANPSTISFDYPPTGDSSYQGSNWGGQKVIWAIDSSYLGPLLLRGARLDGPQELRFDHYLDAYGAGDGNGAFPELAYPAQEVKSLRTPPSAVRMQAAGCYAIQVDGTSFSEIIVFRAELTRS
jgi:hypothetical protein